MTSRIDGWRALALTLPVLFLASCAGTSDTTPTDVDMTPTMRLKADAHVGKGWSSDSTKVENISDTFTPNETVYATVDMPGSAEGTLRVRWSYGDETLQEMETPLQSGVNVYPYKLLPPAEGFRTGDYRFEVFINNNSTDSEKFRIQSP
jgi:hypothetical protein